MNQRIITNEVFQPKRETVDGKKIMFAVKFLCQDCGEKIFVSSPEREGNEIGYCPNCDCKHSIVWDFKLRHTTIHSMKNAFNNGTVIDVK